MVSNFVSFDYHRKLTSKRFCLLHRYPNQDCPFTSKVLLKGELAVNDFDPSSFNATQSQEAKQYFQDAITEHLKNVWNIGDSIRVTSLRDNGNVEYEIQLYSNSISDANTDVDNINSALSRDATLEAISVTVQTESQTSPSGIANDLSNISIESNTQISTTGIDTIVDGRAVNPEAEDEAWHPEGVQNYYFPDFNLQSCVSSCRMCTTVCLKQLELTVSFDLFYFCRAGLW